MDNFLTNLASSVQMQQPDMQSIASEAPRLTQKRTLGNVLSDFFSGDRIARNMRDPGIAAWQDVFGNIVNAAHGQPFAYGNTGRVQALQDRDRQEQARNAFAQIFEQADPTMAEYAKYANPSELMPLMKSLQPKEPPEFIRTMQALGVDLNTPEGMETARRAYEGRFNQPRYIGNEEQGYQISPGYHSVFGQREGVAGGLPNGTPAQTNVPQGSPLKGSSNSMTIMGPKGPVQAWNINGKWYDNPEGR